MPYIVTCTLIFTIPLHLLWLLYDGCSELRGHGHRSLGSRCNDTQIPDGHGVKHCRFRLHIQSGGILNFVNKIYPLSLSLSLSLSLHQSLQYSLASFDVEPPHSSVASIAMATAEVDLDVAVLRAKILDHHKSTCELSANIVYAQSCRAVFNFYTEGGGCHGYFPCRDKVREVADYGTDYWIDWKWTQ